MLPSVPALEADEQTNSLMSLLRGRVEEALRS